MIQKFFLKIDAESPDGEAVQCSTQIKSNCSEEMVISIFASVLKQDRKFRKAIIEALMLDMSDEKFSETISDEEFKKRFKDEKPPENLEF